MNTDQPLDIDNVVVHVLPSDVPMSDPFTVEDLRRACYPKLLVHEHGESCALCPPTQ